MRSPKITMYDAYRTLSNGGNSNATLGYTDGFACTLLAEFARNAKWRLVNRWNFVGQAALGRRGRLVACCANLTLPLLQMLA